MRLIDADALIEWLRPYGHLDEKVLFDELVEDINAQPTIEAEPVRHGTWVYDSFTKYRCSNCNSPAPQYGYKKTYVAKTNYCPNCGKPMDGGVSDEG